MNPYEDANGKITDFEKWAQWELENADKKPSSSNERPSEPREPNREPSAPSATTRPSATPPPSSGSTPPSSGSRPSTATASRPSSPAMIPGTSTTPPNYVDQRRNELLAQGGSPNLPPGATQVGPTRATDGQSSFTFYPDYGLWVNSGFTPNAGDRSAAVTSIQSRNAATGQSPYANLAPFAGSGGTLTPDQTPQLPTFAGVNQPGFGVPMQGRGFMYSGEGLNQLGINPQGTTNGPVVQAPPGRAPASMGYGPGVSTNIHQFSQRPGGTTEAQKQFASVPVSVPAGYRPGPSGFSQSENGGSFRAFDMPINAGPGGTGFVQLSGPTTMQIGNSGYLTSGGPAVDPFAVYGRQGSPDAAVRAVQAAQLIDERNALLARGYSPQNVIDLLSAVREGPPLPEVREYSSGPAAPAPVGQTAGTMATGYGAGQGLAGAGAALTGAVSNAAAAALAAAKEEEEKEGEGEGIRFYAKGGSVATGPFGRPDQVTNEPIIALGMKTGLPHFIAGEDNADPDTKPNPELINITPIRGYSTGGTVATGAVGTTSDPSPGYGTPPTMDPGITPVVPPAPAPAPAPVPAPTPAPSVPPAVQPAPTNTAPVVSTAPVTTTTAVNLNPIPTMPALTQPVALDSGPEVQSALRAARIAQQQASQNHLRARAGLGGTIGIRTNAQMEGLPPGYYTTPADYSQQISDLQTQLAGLGNISANPNELLAYQNTLEQLLEPLQQAQALQTELEGLGELGDPVALQAQIDELEQQMAPLLQAQQIQLRRLGLGQVGDPNQLNQQIVGINQQLGPLSSVVDLQQQLTALGGPQDATNLIGILNYYRQALAEFEETGVWSPVVEEAQQAIVTLPNQISAMLAHNNQIAAKQAAFNNLLASTGMTWEQIQAQTGTLITQREALQAALAKALEAAELDQQFLQYAPLGTDIGALLSQKRTQLDAAKVGYENTQKAAQLRAQLLNFVPEGFDVSGRVGEITGNINAARNAYEASIRAGQLQGQIEAYRNNTDIEGMDVNQAPAPVIQQAVVSTPVLKQIAQSDPTSANALAKMDYALSSDGQWTPATSQLLVNLTNSLSGSKAKGSVQALLQSLVAKMAGNQNVPPALAAAAASGDAARISAAAKFGSQAA